MNTRFRTALFESAIWLSFALLAYIFSFKFDKTIEIYRFGASGWPRMVILLIVIAAVCQLITGWLEERRAERAGQQLGGDGPEESTMTSESDLLVHLRVVAVLLMPLGYAVLLESIGFYTLTPILVIGFLLLAGETRWKVILSVTVGLYVFFVIVFGRFLYINLPVGNMHPFYDFSNWLLTVIR